MLLKPSLLLYQTARGGTSGDLRPKLKVGEEYSRINKHFNFFSPSMLKTHWPPIFVQISQNAGYLSTMMRIHILDLGLLVFVVGNDLTANVLADDIDLSVIPLKG